MDRGINNEEKDKVRAARASYFGLQKRPLSTSPPNQSNSVSTSATHNQAENMPLSKRFKIPGMGSSTSQKPVEDASKTPLIVAFYDPEVQAQDAHDRTMEEIIEWPDVQLERCHNYIQMLFPVPEGSMFNWEAPVIDRQVMDAFLARAELRQQLQRSFERMLHFYGFAIASELEEQENEDAEEEESSEGADPSDAGEQSKGTAGPTNDNAATSDAPETTSKDPAASATPNEESLSQPYTIVRGPNWHRNSRNWAVRFDHNHLRITRILRCLRVLGLQEQCDAFFAALQDVFDDPDIHINERSMIYWKRAATRPLYIAPDDDRIEWLRKWEAEQEKKEGGSASGMVEQV